MKFSACLLVFVLVACTVEPVALKYGQDACYSCKMTLTDQRFGGEVVTTKGKVFTFDDTRCMVNFLNSGELNDRDIAFRLMVDFTQPGKLIPVEHGYFLKSDTIRTPMNSGVAAFETEQAMRTFKKQWKAIYLGWGELQTEYK